MDMSEAEMAGGNDLEEKKIEQMEGENEEAEEDN